MKSYKYLYHFRFLSVVSLTLTLIGQTLKVIRASEGKSKANFSDKSRIAVLYSISIAYLAFALLRYQAITFSDLSVYWVSALSIHRGGTAYVQLDPTAPYVYGSFLSSLFSHLTFISYTTLFCLWFIFNVGLMYLICRFTYRKLFKEISAFRECVLFSLLAVSYPVRHSLALGQVVILVLFFILISFYFHENPITEWRSWIGAASLVFAFELKPYLVIFFIFFLVFKKRYIFLLQSFIIILILNFYYYFALNTSTWINWYTAIKDRSSNLTSDGTQTTLLNLVFNNLPVNTLTAVLIYASSVLLLLFFSFKSWNLISTNSQIFLLFTLGPIISIYSHEQDFVFSIFAVLVVLSRNSFQSKEFWLIPLFFAFYLNIASPEIFKSLLVHLLLILVLYFSKTISTRKQLLVIFAGNIFIQLLARDILKQFGEFRQLQLLKLFCLTLGYLCWYALLTSSKQLEVE